MATKLKKLPRKPKAGASIATMENWLAKVKEIERFNANVVKERKRHADLRKKISGISASSVMPRVGTAGGYSVGGTRKRKKAATKAAPKKSRKAAVSGTKRKHSTRKKATPRKRSTRRR